MVIHHADQLYTNDQVKAGLQQVIVIGPDIQVRYVSQREGHPQTQKDNACGQHKCNEVLQESGQMFENGIYIFFL